MSWLNFWVASWSGVGREYGIASWNGVGRAYGNEDDNAELKRCMAGLYSEDEDTGDGDAAGRVEPRDFSVFSNFSEEGAGDRRRAGEGDREKVACVVNDGRCWLICVLFYLVCKKNIYIILDILKHERTQIVVSDSFHTRCLTRTTVVVSIQRLRAIFGGFRHWLRMDVQLLCQSIRHQQLLFYR